MKNLLAVELFSLFPLFLFLKHFKCQLTRVNGDEQTGFVNAVKR
jgi:hypothetical protein